MIDRVLFGVVGFVWMIISLIINQDTSLLMGNLMFCAALYIPKIWSEK